jgi:transcriptional regulator with XRE-family HTH domain
VLSNRGAVVSAQKYTGADLIRVRVDRSLSQKAFALALGTSAASVWRWERRPDVGLSSYAESLLSQFLENEHSDRYPVAPEIKVRVMGRIADEKNREKDVERFTYERILASEGSMLTATTVFEEYCDWCETQKQEPLALPTFGRKFGDMGIQKAKLEGRVRYLGIAIRGHENQRVPIPAQGVGVKFRPREDGRIEINPGVQLSQAEGKKIQALHELLRECSD